MGELRNYIDPETENEMIQYSTVLSQTLFKHNGITDLTRDNAMYAAARVIATPDHELPLLAWDSDDEATITLNGVSVVNTGQTLWGRWNDTQQRLFRSDDDLKENPLIDFRKAAASRIAKVKTAEALNLYPDEGEMGESKDEYDKSGTLAEKLIERFGGKNLITDAKWSNTHPTNSSTKEVA